MASWKKAKGQCEPMEISVEECNFEESFVVAKSSKSDRKFDETVGHIEDIIMDDKFQQLQSDFLSKHYQVFEDAEENKLIYTDIHNEYTLLIEKFLESELCRRMPEFNMVDFQKQLTKQRKELDGEIFEILLTFTDFLAFKEMILDYKAEREGRSVDLGSGFTVSSVDMPKEASRLQFVHPTSAFPAQGNAESPADGIPGDCDDESMQTCQSDHRNEIDIAQDEPQQQQQRSDVDLGLCLIGSSMKRV